MHRLLIALLSAFDAAVAAAAGVVLVLAPLTVLWVVGFGGTADWATLWPVGASIWQLGHLVPLFITLPELYLVEAGIAPDAASFVLSLAPLALTAFTAIFAARSGARGSRADGWATGVIAGSVTFAALTTLITLSARNPVAAIHLWQAVLFPTLVFVLPAIAGAVVTEWREAGAGVIARLRDRAEERPHGWSEVPGLAALGAVVVWVGLLGLGALAVAVALLVGGGDVIALFEAGHMDALGATVTTLAQLAYLPNLAIWAFCYIAGPGFALGVDTAVSPSGTQVGVVPGIPVFGAVPESSSPWLLLLALLPVALGALAGWIARSRLVAPRAVAADRVIPQTAAPWATASLEGLIGAPPEVVEEPEPEHEHEPIAARLALTLAIAVLAGAGAALMAALASGSIGPGRLAEVGPQPGPVALVVGLEVLVGAGILLLSPSSRSRSRGHEGSHDVALTVEDAATSGTDETGPLEPLPTFVPVAAEPLPPFPPAVVTPVPEDETGGPAPRRPGPLPPVD